MLKVTLFCLLVYKSRILQFYLFIIYFSSPIFPSKFFVMYHRDIYEGTRVATVSDLAGIKKLIHPLEESGVFVKRTDEEVFIADFFFLSNVFFEINIFILKLELLA
jgi:hypothetical protein